MEGQLKNGTILTSESGNKYTVVNLLGAGGQGEVYDVECDGKHYALKWYFKGSATARQKKLLEEIIAKGAPDSSFLWPMELIVPSQGNLFGYIMPLRPKNYKSIVDLMKNRVNPSFYVICRTAFNLTKGYRNLHIAGAKYQDISFGNLFFNPDNGDVLICDNDNVSYGNSKPGGVLGTPGFMAPEIVRGEARPSRDTDRYSLAVLAITRGKGKVITVANARFWGNVFKGTNHIFYKLLQHIKNGKHQVIDNHDKTLQPYIESVNPGRMINIFMNEQDAISMFEQDMKKAKWQTVVSLPSGELRETEHQVFEILDEADSRGVDIKMKSNDYAKLPEQWKEYCVGTENATFPLIIIDDEVVWYGLPTAKWKFQVDKTTSMITVVHSMVRIKGKNTVEMIKALADIETVVVGQNIRKLDNKKSKLVTNSFAASSGNSEDNGSILNYGLGAFVEEKEFCPKCKNHMILAKNARGTAYLKCSNKACKETKYLTVDLMNWYINSHNIKCPKRDGGELKGGLGKYGPYVRCNCGHFLKPDEI